MNAGLDLGAACSKVAGMGPDGRPALLAHPAASADRCVPSAVAYGAAGPKIGVAALAAAGAELRTGFKPLLPLPGPEGWRAAGWPAGRAPATVARDFVVALLAGVLPPGLPAAAGLVAALPERWLRPVPGPGAAALHDVLSRDRRLPLRHLVSDLACAAAHVIHRCARDGHDVRTVVVCDVGASRFDVGLCRLEGRAVRVLDLAGGGPGALDFDRAAVRAAYVRAHGRQPGPDGEELVPLLRALDGARRRDGGGAAAAFRAAHEQPALFPNPPIHRFTAPGPGGGDVTEYVIDLTQVRDCLRPMGAAVEAALTVVLARAAGRGVAIDGSARLALVGGFGRFEPVRQLVADVLARHLGVHRLELSAEGDEVAAVACGALLFAEDVFEPRVYLPHAVGLRLHRRAGDRIVPGRVTLAAPGTVEIGSGMPVFARTGAGAVVVRVERSAPGPLPVDIGAEGRWRPLPLPDTAWPPPGDYEVGVRIDRDGRGELVLRPAGGASVLTWPLGDLDEGGR